MRAVLTFHSIDDSGSVLSYAPKTFNMLLEALEHGGIPILSLDELLRPETTCGVALTFDDGMRTVFSQALPILRSHAAAAHLFLTTAFVGTNSRAKSSPNFDMLDWAEIEALQANGVRIEAHTKSHPHLRELSDAAAISECESANAAIAARLGTRPRYFAYPYGESDTRIRAIARGRYEASFTTDLRALGPREDSAALPRLDAFYLRRRVIFANLTALHTQAFLAFRRALRKIRG